MIVSIISQFKIDLFLERRSSCMKPFKLLTKDVCLIMKGIAILCIVLHNLLHLRIYGYAQENEVTFSFERYNYFINHFLSLDQNLVGDVISFLGWLGVPVFVFLSGYGLSKKYDDYCVLSKGGGKKYVTHSYQKLLLLLLPAILFLLFNDIVHLNRYGIFTKIFSLSLLSNCFSFLLNYPVVVYWYLGLTFELYILFLVFNKWQSSKLLLWSGLACVFIQASLYFIDGSSRLLHYFRDNFIGWLPIFNLGIYYARNSITKDWKLKGIVGIALAFVCFVVLIIMNSNYFLWILMPIMAIPICIIVSSYINHIPYLNKVFLWLGKYSASIFIVHPLIRMLDYSILRELSIIICVGAYLLMTLVTAYFYQIIYSALKAKFLNQ